MKPKCSFYRVGICSNPDYCVFEVWHYQKKECRKGGLLKTPNKLKFLEGDKMDITTLKDLKIALSVIPDKILEELGAGINPEGDTGDMPQLLIWGTDSKDTDFIERFVKYEEKHPQLKEIGKWIKAIGTEAVKSEKEDDSVDERDTPISSIEVKD